MTTEDFFQAQLHCITHTVLLPNSLSVPFKPNTSACIFVVFQFYPWFEFDFPKCFKLIIIMNYQTQKCKNRSWAKDKIKPQHILPTILRC